MLIHLDKEETASRGEDRICWADISAGREQLG